MKLQEYGTSWLIILEGCKYNVDLLFNACFNFGATNSTRLEYSDNDDYAVFWSCEEKMGNFFYQMNLNKLLNMGHEETEELENKAIEIAENQMSDLWENHRESRQLFGQKNLYTPDSYSVGKISAERPDECFLTSVLNHAFANKEGDAKDAETIAD